MEDLKCNFAPMLSSTFASFDGSMDATGAGGYYYHSSSSADSSPVMASISGASFDSSPNHSPPPPYYGFEMGGSSSSLTSPQYYMTESNCVEQYQPLSTQEFFSTPTSNNMSSGVSQLQQQQEVHIPGINELARLFKMASKVEDKLAIQAKINSLLFEQIPGNKRQQQQQQQITYMVDPNGLNPNHTLITPPLSPNGDNMFMSKQNPMFMQQSPLKQSNLGATRSMLSTGGHHQLVKVEPLSPTLMGRKISQSSFGEAANSNNNNNTVADSNGNNSGLLLAGQSPSQNSSKAAGSIYFEQQQQQQFNGCQQYGSNGIIVSDPIPESVLPMDHQANQSNHQCAELKSMMVAAAGKAPKMGKQKGKGKGKKSAGDLRKSIAAGIAGFNQGGSPPQSQKRTAHLSAEFRYRTKLNDKISKLRSLVGQKVHLSKSAVLTRSIERIVKLQKLTVRLHESNLRLQSMVAKFTSAGGAAQNLEAAINKATTPASSAPLMSIKELTRSLSVGSGSSLLNSSGRGSGGQFGGSSQTTIDIDLAKYIDSQMLSSPDESDHLPATIESTVNCSSSNSSSSPSSGSSSPSGPSVASGNSLALSPTDEVFDFDQFLDQF